MADFGLDDFDDILGELNDSLAGLDEEFQLDPTPSKRLPTTGQEASRIDQELAEKGLKRTSMVIEFAAVTPQDWSTTATAAPVAVASPTFASQHASPPAAVPATDEKSTLDILSELTAATLELDSFDPHDSQKKKEQKIQEAMQKMREAAIKKLTIRVYINDDKTFKSLVVTSLMNAEQVIADALEKAHLDPHPDWTLFECVLDYGVERPIRSYEKLTDIIWTWDMETTNIIMLRQYPEKRVINSFKTTHEFPRMQGVMYLEQKKGKWQKRYVELKFSGIYHYKDTKLSQEAVLCNWADFDAYYNLVERKKAPSKFCFALKSQNRMKPTETEDDHIKFLAVESEEIMNQWIACIRGAKNRKFLEDHPEYVTDQSLLKVSAEKEVLTNLVNAVGRDKKDLIFQSEQEKAARKAAAAASAPAQETSTSPTPAAAPAPAPVAAAAASPPTSPPPATAPKPLSRSLSLKESSSSTAQEEAPSSVPPAVAARAPPPTLQRSLSSGGMPAPSGLPNLPPPPMKPAYLQQSLPPVQEPEVRTTSPPPLLPPLPTGRSSVVLPMLPPHIPTSPPPTNLPPVNLPPVNLPPLPTAAPAPVAASSLPPLPTVPAKPSFANLPTPPAIPMGPPPVRSPPPVASPPPASFAPPQSAAPPPTVMRQPAPAPAFAAPPPTAVRQPAPAPPKPAVTAFKPTPGAAPAPPAGVQPFRAHDAAAYAPPVVPRPKTPEPPSEALPPPPMSRPPLVPSVPPPGVPAMPSAGLPPVPSGASMGGVAILPAPGGLPQLRKAAPPPPAGVAPAAAPANDELAERMRRIAARNYVE